MRISFDILRCFHLLINSFQLSRQMIRLRNLFYLFLRFFSAFLHVITLRVHVDLVLGFWVLQLWILLYFLLALLFLPTRIINWSELLYCNICCLRFVNFDGLLSLLNFCFHFRLFQSADSHKSTLRSRPMSITLHLIREIANYLYFGLVETFGMSQLILQFKIVKRIFLGWFLLIKLL